MRNPQAVAWLSAGWVAADVRLDEGLVTFKVGQPSARPSTGRAQIMDGSAALERFVVRAGFLSVEAAVAAHTVFLHPDTVAQTDGRAVFPIVRDMVRRGQFGELRDGRPVLFDDNSTPTDAFLWAADRVKGPDVQFNHVWNCSTDPEAYTALWNLCCSPAFLAKATDSHVGAIALLRFRAYDLYGRRPAGYGVPPRPENYEDVEWAAMPEPLASLEATFRARLKSAPGRRGALAARTIGWLFSSEPDLTV